MPPKGAFGAVNPRKIQEAARRPAPPARSLPPTPTRPQPRQASLPVGRLTTQPFAPAQRQAQRKVETAQAQVGHRPPPYIPRLPNPTPQQVAAAHAVAVHYQRQMVGPRPSGKQILDFKRELANDPRAREYLRTVEHYVRAGERHLQLPSQPERADVRPPAKDWGLPLLGVANIRIPGTAALASKLGSALGSLAPGLASATPETKFFKAGLGDLAAIGSFPVVGGYKLAEGGVQAAGGNTKPIRQLASGVAKGLEQGAVGQLVQGKLSGVERAVREHPVLSALEAAGATGLAGRTAGALARGVGGQAERSALGRLGSTVRPPIALSNDAGSAARGLVRERTYSKDLTRKFAQQTADQRREFLTDAQGRRVFHRDSRGVRVPVLKSTEREAERFQKRRGNFTSSRSVAMQREARNVSTKEYLHHVYPGRGPAPVRALLTTAKGGLRPTRIKGERAPISTATLRNHLAHLVASGTLRSARTFREDLDKRIANIAHELKTPENYRTREELKAAQGNLALLQAARGNESLMAQAGAIVKQGTAHAKALNSADAGLLAHHYDSASRLERARLSEYAAAHMEARHVTVEEHEALEAAARSRGLSRREQLEVSGREPEQALAHEHAKAGVAAAHDGQRKASAKLAGLEKRLAGRSAAARRQRGRTKGERRKDAQGVEELKTAVASAREAFKDARKAHSEAREHLRRTPMPARNAGIRHPTGHFLSNKEIAEHAQAAGRNPETLAYLPHRMGAERARSFYKSFRPGARPTADSALRTLSLYRRGATAISTGLVHDELTNKATTLAFIRNLDHTVQEAGLRHPDYAAALEGEQGLSRAQQRLVRKGGYFTGSEGLEAAKRLSEDTGTPYLAVRGFSSRLTSGQQELLRGEQDPATMETAHLGLLRERLVGPEDTSNTRNVVLMPAHLVNQLERQIRPAHGFQRGLQMLNAPFRMAVLPQPRWLTGNFIEPFFVRLPLSGSGANIPGLLVDLHAANKAVKALEASGPAGKRAAEQIRSLQFQGLFIGRKGASVRRTYLDFTGDSERLLYGAHVVRNLPAVKQFGDMALSLPHAFFHINRVIEGTAQRAAFGKQFRSDLQEFTGSWSQTVLLGQKAVEEASRGLVNTATQHRFMERQYELLGQYDGFSPVLREVVQTAAPFLPWTLNSLRFVYWTLPAHHTVAFDGFVKSAQAVMGEWEREHADVPPGTLQFAPRTKGGGYVDIGHYTPFGITEPLSATPAEGLNLAGETVLPAFSGFTKALQGKDPFGRDLLVPKPGGGNQKASQGQDIGIAANSLLESLVPGVAMARRLQEKGGTGYGNSFVFSPKVKPGTSHQSAINRTLNPFRPIFLKAPKGSGAGLSPAQQTLVSHAEAQADTKANPARESLVKLAEEAADRAAKR